MSTALHGDSGYAYVSGTAIGLVHKWSMNWDHALDDITAMDSAGWQHLMIGIKKVTGSITLGYATDDAQGSALQNNAVGGTVVTLALYPSGTAKSFGGSAFIKLSMDVSFDVPVEAVYDFSSHGPWAYS